MSSRSRRGFTLVELLVVVVIIAMLAGLLVPAVISARAAARKTECMNNQRELANAAIQYETAKGHFPGYRNPTLLPDGSSNTPNSWVTVLLPYLGRGDLWREWRNGYQPPTADKDESPRVRLDQLVCPDDLQDGPCPLSYVANCGMFDGDAPGSSVAQPDYPCNGVFFDRTLNSPIEVSASGITDGAAQTLMISENVRAVGWPESLDTSGNLDDPVEGKLGFTWVLADSETQLKQMRITHCGPKPDQVPSDDRPRPGNLASNHSGGAIVTFCDQHGQFLNEDIHYRVYQHLMTPSSQEAQTRIRAVNSSDDYNLIGTLSEGDY